MGVVSELFDGISKFKFWTTINEYQNGLFYHRGVAIPRRIKDSTLDELLQTEWESIQEEKIERKEENAKDKLVVTKNTPKDLNHLQSLEEKAYREFLKNDYLKNNPTPDYSSKKYIDFENSNVKKYHYDKNHAFLWFSKEKPKFDPSFNKEYSDWSVSSTGNPLHPTRFRKNLPHGIYMHYPPVLDIQSVYEASTKPIVRNVELVTLLAKDSSTGSYVSLSMKIMLRYKIEDLDKASNNVSLWESSYQSHALVKISNYCREKTVQDFYSKTLNDDLIKHLKIELNEMPRKDWGIRTLEVGVTTVAITNVNRNMNEFETDGMNLKITNDSIEKIQ